MNPTDIQQLVQKYGQAVYDAALRQVYIDTVTFALWAIVALAAFFGMLRGASWARRHRENAGSYDAGDWMLGSIFFYIGAGIFALITGLLVTQAIVYVVNPTWAAIQIILGAAHGNS